jgi:hypothetical protein
MTTLFFFISYFLCGPQLLSEQKFYVKKFETNVYTSDGIGSCFSRTEPNRTEPKNSETESNRTKRLFKKFEPNRIEPKNSQSKPNRTEPNRMNLALKLAKNTILCRYLA